MATVDSRLRQFPAPEIPGPDALAPWIKRVFPLKNVFDKFLLLHNWYLYSVLFSFLFYSFLLPIKLHTILMLFWQGRLAFRVSREAYVLPTTMSEHASWREPCPQFEDQSQPKTSIAVRNFRNLIGSVLQMMLRTHPGPFPRNLATNLDRARRNSRSKTKLEMQ